MTAQVAKIGKRGALIIPLYLRKKFSLSEGDLLITEETNNGILLRPAVALPIETYSPERKAEFLLSNVISKQDYLEARKTVTKMGLDPDKIKHLSPPTT